MTPASQSSIKLKNWPCLNELLERGEVSYADYALAESLLTEEGNTEEPAAFLCYISMAARQGHLCVHVDGFALDPEPVRLFANETDSALPLEMAQKIHQMILAGSKKVPEAILAICNSPEESIHTKPLCRFGNFFYFQRFWSYETDFCRHFLDLLKAPLVLQLNANLLYERVSQMLFQNRLLPEQAAAILRASQQTLTLICGGPGTGKTYTAGQLINLFIEAMTPEQQKHCQIAIAAPTGKAAANLQKSLQTAVGASTSFKTITARTIHSLLGMRESGRRKDDSPSKLNADLILVDECSMIDAKLMGELLRAVKPGARLILLGDKHQLPPVEAGSVFADMIAFLNTCDPKERPSELKICLRAELKGIVDFADLINAGDADQALEKMHSSIEGVFPLKLNSHPENIGSAQNAIVEYALPFFPKPGQQEHHLEKMLTRFNQFRILSPLRKGPFGVDELNQLFLKRAMRQVHGGQVLVAPIMLTTSHAKLELFNGEVGILVKHLASKKMDTHCEEGDYALFPCHSAEEKNKWRKFPALVLPAFEYAYCLSIHKSQGSEFDHVLLLMPQGSESFGREVLYTAVTRARKKLDIWEQPGIISETIKRLSLRFSGIKNRLKFSTKQE